MINFSTQLKYGFCVAALLALSACGTVEQAVVGGADLQQEAAKTQASIAPVRPCPDVELVEGETVRTVYGKGEENNPKAVVYQAIIFDTARECASFGPTFEFRLGVRGRLTPGALAQPGQTINLNVHMQFGKGEEKLWEATRQVSVTIGSDLAPVDFSFVEENGAAILPEGKDEFDYDYQVKFLEKPGRR